MKAYATCMDGTKVLPFAVSSSYPRTTSLPGLIIRASRARRLQQSLHRVCFLVPLMRSSDWIIFMSLTRLSSPHVAHLTFSGSSGACAYTQSFKKQMSSQFPKLPGPPKKPSRPTRGAHAPGPARPTPGPSQISGDLEIWEFRIPKNPKIKKIPKSKSVLPKMSARSRSVNAHFLNCRMEWYGEIVLLECMIFS